MGKIEEMRMERLSRQDGPIQNCKMGRYQSKIPTVRLPKKGSESWTPGSTDAP